MIKKTQFKNTLKWVFSGFSTFFIGMLFFMAVHDTNDRCIFQYMGVFRDIQNATIINKSNIQNAFNKIEKEHDKETNYALVEIAKFIEKFKKTSGRYTFQ